MVSISIKNILHDKTRFIITVIGTSLIVSLILFNIGMIIGTITQNTRYVKSVDADLWVIEEDEDFYSFSKLPTSMIDSINTIDDVDLVSGLMIQEYRLKHNGYKSEKISMIGYNISNHIGGPSTLISGKHISNDFEIIIDHKFAQENNLKINNNISITDPKTDVDFDFWIVGLSESRSLRGDYGFMSYDAAQSISPLVNITNFILIQTNNPKQVRDDIYNIINGVDVLTTGMIVDEITSFWLGVMGSGNIFMCVIAIIIGIIIAGITLYTATIEKRKEYGVLKAIGARNRYIYKSIIFQSLTIMICAFIVAILVSQLLSLIFTIFVSKMEILLNLIIYFFVFMITLMIGILSSLIAIKRVVKIDPLIVFQE